MTEPAPRAGPGRNQAGEAPWGDPPQRSQNTAPLLSVEGFEGPLDWLLEMARAQQIDLTKLSILALVEAFAAALDHAISAPHRGGNGPVAAGELARWGDWLVMAATLTLLRSRLLLPDTPQGRAAQDEGLALHRQLVRRAAMASAARWLDRRPQLGREVFARGRPEHILANRVGDITGLLRACLVVLRGREPGEVDQPTPPPLWRVGDALALITRTIADQPEGGAIERFLPKVSREGVDRDLRCRAVVASTFAAGLELARGEVLVLEQMQPFGTIAFRAARPLMPRRRRQHNSNHRELENGNSL